MVAKAQRNGAVLLGKWFGSGFIAGAGRKAKMKWGEENNGSYLNDDRKENVQMG